MKPYTIIIAILLAIAAGCLYLWGYSSGKKQCEKVIIEQIDTLVVRDTIKIEKPVEVAYNIIKDKIVEIPVYIETRDTVIQKVYIPREERQYKADDYFAVVSGVDPSLDYLEVFPKTTTITKTETVYQNVRQRWSVGIQGGYGVSTNGPVPYIGVGIQYNLFSFGRAH